VEAIITAINKLTETKEPEVDKLLKEMEAMGASADASAEELMYLGNNTYVKCSEWEHAFGEYMDRQDLVIGMDTSEVYSLSMSEEAFERAVRL
jgi:hypothetical protein